MAADLEFFHLKMGVHQGCPMSALLFSLYYDRAVHHIHSQVESMHMVQMGSINVAAALYADDVALPTHAFTSL